ncbi:MAG TPA: lysophospholipid acyltransferase family protein, partial [Thermoanaerobaculia bacterium]|nr:lysophospholipid acyltransferase family protein [Thermoanaerobaculia bacterium]
GAGHRILNAVRRGRVVALSIDQRVRPSQGIAVPFFGRPAWTSPVVAFVSTHANVPVVPCFCLPGEGGGYRVELKAPIVPSQRGPEEVERLTRLYNEAVEDQVRAHPGHYLWMHRRWA